MSARDVILRRTVGDETGTLGELYDGPLFRCFTFELAWRGNARRISRIPAGRYPLLLRGHGRFYADYTARWPSWHDEMIEAGSVPGRSAILFHIGNAAADTEGCILVGENTGRTSEGGLAVWNSTDTYQRVYPMLYAAAARGAQLSVIDPEQQP